MPFFDTFFYRQHINTVDWAGLYAKVAAGALIGNHGVHKFSGTQYGVDGAGLDTFGTANAFVFANVGNGFKVGFFAVLSV